MLDFFKSLFRPGPPSGTLAKERLRLVLLSDHLELAPDVVEALKSDLISVISRYVDIDREHTEVTFEQRESEVAMLASIPITAVRERPKPSGDLHFETSLIQADGDAASLERAWNDEPGDGEPALVSSGAQPPAASNGVPSDAVARTGSGSERAEESSAQPSLELSSGAQPAQPRRSGHNGSRRRRRKKYNGVAAVKRQKKQPPPGEQAAAQG
jgi:cell division topological specificity factor